MRTFLKGYEFRTLIDDEFKDRDSDKMIEYMVLIVEDLEDDCKQERISVPTKLFDIVSDIDIKRGDLVDLSVDITTGKFSKIRLLSIDRIYSPDGEVYATGDKLGF